MINPTEVTNFNRSQAQTEQFALFAILVAGKNSDVAAKKLEEICFKVFQESDGRRDVLTWIIENHEHRHEIQDFFKSHNTGQHTRIGTHIDKMRFEIKKKILLKLPVEVLEKKMGPKTARFFMLHSIKDCECIPLDTHILSWMRDNGADVPSATPKPGKRYREIEEECLAMFKELLPEGKSVAEKDLMVWMKQSGRVRSKDGV